MKSSRVFGRRGKQHAYWASCVPFAESNGNGEIALFRVGVKSRRDSKKELIECCQMLP
jgi:hypothetical protein